MRVLKKRFVFVIYTTPDEFQIMSIFVHICVSNQIIFADVKMANRVTEIDGRLAQIEIEKQATQNEELLILLAKERLALTNERISLTSPAPPAPAPGNYLIL